MKVFEKIAELDSKYSYATADAKSELKRTVANTIRPYIEDRGRYDSTEETFSTLDSVWRYEFNRIYNPNDPEWKTYRREDPEVIESKYFTFGEGIDAIEITLGDFYNILLEVTAEDEISFSYFRHCILAEIAEATGLPAPAENFPPRTVISYAIKFDFEDVDKAAKGIPDLRKRLEYLENQLTSSRLKADVAQDERGAKIKTIFEQQVSVLIEITNNKIVQQHSLASSSKPVLLMDESVERMDLIEQGKGDRYLTFYDFNSCPIDVRAEPYRLNLADYKVTKTVEGLGDASSILAKILINIAESLQYVNTSGAKKHYDSTRLLLKTLFGIFIKQCYNMYPDDFERVAVNAKMWAISTIGMIQGITDNINIHNEDPYSTNYDGETFHSSATKNILHFRKTMWDYCLFLAVGGISKLPNHPDKRVFQVVPYNYYGDDFAERRNAAEFKRIKNEEDRVVTDYYKNCGNLSKYVEEKMRTLDGMGLNDASNIEQRHNMANEVIDMANDYLARLDSIGVVNRPALAMSIKIWLWQFQETVENELSFKYKVGKCVIDHDEYKNGDEYDTIVRNCKNYVAFRDLMNKTVDSIRKDFYTSLQSTPAPYIVDSIPGEDNEIEPEEEQQEKADNSTNAVKEFSFPELSDEDLGKVYECIKSFRKGNVIVNSERGIVTRDEFIRYFKIGDLSKIYCNGITTRLKYAIKVINDYAEEGWLESVAKSVDSTKREVIGTSGYSFNDDYMARFPIKSKK